MSSSLALCQGCELPGQFKHFLLVTKDTLPQPSAKDFLPANELSTPEVHFRRQAYDSTEELSFDLQQHGSVPPHLCTPAWGS